MAYQLYRNTTLGNSLQESLDELIQSQQINPTVALQVLLQFDKAINAALAQRVRNRVNFRAFSSRALPCPSLKHLPDLDWTKICVTASLDLRISTLKNKLPCYTS